MYGADSMGMSCKTRPVCFVMSLVLVLLEVIETCLDFLSLANFYLQWLICSHIGIDGLKLYDALVI